MPFQQSPNQLAQNPTPLQRFTQRFSQPQPATVAQPAQPAQAIPSQVPTQPAAIPQDFSSFQARPVPTQGARDVPPQTTFGQNQANIAARQQDLLGVLGGLLPISPQRPLQRGDVPLVQAGLNYENRLLAELDRARGLEELRGSLGGLGGSLESQESRRLALERALAGGLQTEDFPLERLRAAAEGQAGLQFQRGQQDIAAAMAGRGIGGVPVAIQQALLRQEAGAGLQQTLGGIEEAGARFGLEQAALQDAISRGALEDLTRVADVDEQRRLDLERALADVFLETQREPLDLSDLLVRVRGGRRAV
jgi:hypothetical protein